MTNREIVLNTEVTGLDPRKGHRLVAIACVELINHRSTGKVYQQYINPGFLMCDEIIAVHGITNEFLADKPKFSKVVNEFLKFIGSDPIIAHNAPFDMNFIQSELKRSHRLVLQNKVIDTLSIARQKFPGKRCDLTALCERFHVNPNKISEAGPLLDAMLLAKVYRLMLFPTLWEKIKWKIKHSPIT